MLKPICVKCQRFYRIRRSGKFVAENRPAQAGAKPGTLEPGAWLPYKVWSADLWVCYGCQHELIVGSGVEPVSVQHEVEFKGWRARCEVEVNDC